MNAVRKPQLRFKIGDRVVLNDWPAPHGTIIDIVHDEWDVYDILFDGDDEPRAIAESMLERE